MMERGFALGADQDMARKIGDTTPSMHSNVTNTGPPATPPPPPNQRPTVSRITATQSRPTTTYHVEASDPDQPESELTYTWRTNPDPLCGDWSPGRSTAVWTHPHPPCPEEPIHPAEIRVTVSDGRGGERTAVYPFGSEPEREAPPPE